MVKNHAKRAPQDHSVDDEGVEEDLCQRVLPEVSEDGGELLADQDKEQRLQHEDQDAPEGERLDARGGVREEPRGSPALVEAVGDHGQDARDVQDLLGEDVDSVGDQDGEGDHDRGLPQAAPQRQDHPREDEADHDPTPADENEVQAGLPDRERAAAQGGQSHAEGHERGAVVYEALAAYYGAHALRHSQAAEDRLGGHRIGRREDRPEDEGRRPRQAGDEVGDGGNRDGGEEDESYGEQDYRPEVRAQVERRGEEGRSVEERRQKDNKDDLGGDLDDGQPRHEADAEASED